MSDLLQKCLTLMSSSDSSLTKQGLELLAVISSEDPDLIKPLGEPIIDEVGWIDWRVPADQVNWKDTPAKDPLEKWLFQYHIENLHPVFLQATRLRCRSSQPSGSDFWKSLSRCARLEHLDISESNLKTVPEEMYRLSNLTTLNLGGNHLTELPSEIGRLSRLQCLLLHDNQLSELPSEIGQLTELRTLVLMYNRLTDLPQEVANLSKLKQLHLRRNRLLEMPRFLSDMPALTELFVDQDQREQFGRGEENAVYYDTWEQGLSETSLLRDLQKREANGSIHFICFDFGAFRDYELYLAAKRRYPELPIMFEWRREAYY